MIEFITGLIVGGGLMFIIQFYLKIKKDRGKETYQRRGLLYRAYNITQLGQKLSQVEVCFEVFEIEKTDTKSKIKVVELTADKSEYNESNPEREKLKKMVDNSWVESSSIEWIEKPLSEKRSSKIDQILDR